MRIGIESMANDGAQSKETMKLLQGKRNLAGIVASIILIGYILFLLGANYLSQVELRKTALEQLKYDAEKYSMTVSYFFLERKDEMVELTMKREVSTYFENQALGMSNEYGLEAGLVDIREIFKRLLERKKLDKDKIYSRIVFIDSTGRLLVDTYPRPDKHDHDGERDWKRLLTPKATDPSVFSECSGEAPGLIASVPYYFKGKYAGQIVAWLPPRVVSSHMVNADAEHSKRIVEVMYDKSRCPLPPEVKCDLASHDLSFQMDKPCRYSVTTGKHNRMDMLLLRIPVRETPFALVLAVPAEEILGHTAPWHLLLAMGALAVTVLTGAAGLIRFNTRNMVLKTRLEESSRREKEIDEKNRQLEDEITRRKVVEDALRKVRDELEKRVEERTVKLSQSNRLLKREIEERKRTEAALKESENRYRTIFENTGTAIIVIEEDTSVSLANTRFEELSGCSKGEIEGKKSWVEFCAGEDLERMKGYHSLRRIDPNAAPRDYEARFIDRSGRIKDVFVSVAMIPETTKSVASFLDITRIKELEHLLRIKDRMTSLGRVAAGIAHELRNPLSGLNLHLTNLERTLGSLRNVELEAMQRLEKLIALIKSTSRRIERVVKRVMDFAKPSFPRLASVDLNRCIEAVIELSAMTLRKSGIELDKSLTPGMPKCFADSHLIEQVLLNLITNAIQAMKDTEGSRRMAIASSLERNCVLVKVADSGPGVPHDIEDKIFDPFFTTQKDGAGIGLSLCHRIITDHGGFLRMSESRWGGAEFSVELPIEKRRNEA